MYTDPTLAHTDLGNGPLPELAAYMMQVSGNPVVCIRGNPSTTGAYGSMTLTGTGTTTPSGTSGTFPYDDYNVIVTCVVGGTLGLSGVSYTYSLDGGVTTSAIIALGTATTLVIPNSGVSIDFTHTSNTLVAGDTVTFTTTGPKLTSGDITTALEALRVSALPWEGVIVDRIDATASSAAEVGALDTWLAGLEAVGKFRFFALNARAINSGETEAQYLTAMTTAMASAASIRGIVGADVGDSVSTLTGLKLARPTSMFVMARAMGDDISTDPAYVAEGALSNCAILDSRGNPRHHNEAAYQGLDAIRLTTLRTIDSRTGVYCTNANIVSSPGSDYVYLQHARVMNKACELAFQALTTQLSRGIPKQAKADPNTGAVYIQEGAARVLEALVQVELNAQLVTPRRVSGAKFALSRTDDLSSNQGATLTGTIEIQALAYAKGFSVNAKFVRSFTVTI